MDRMKSTLNADLPPHKHPFLNASSGQCVHQTSWGVSRDVELSIESLAQTTQSRKASALVTAPWWNVNLDNQFYVSKYCLSSDFERREICAHPKLNGSTFSMITTQGGAYMTRVVLSTVTPLFRPPHLIEGTYILITDQSYRAARTVRSQSVIHGNLIDVHAYLSIEFRSSQLECHSFDEMKKKRNLTDCRFSVSNSSLEAWHPRCGE